MLEGPYKLPEGWRWVRLGEVAEVCYGKANPKKPGSVPVVGSSGVYDYTAFPLISFPTVVVGRKGNAGEALLVKGPCWPSDTVFYLRWLVDISPEWVAAWLKVHKPSSEGTSPTLPSLRREELESHLIPLPPLAEQRRIVARIEALTARVREARRLREQAREEAERLWQSVLADTFPRPGSALPPGWRWVRLEEVASLRMGETLLKRQLGPNGVPVFSAQGSDIPWGSTKENRLCFDERSIVIGARGTIGFPRWPNLPRWTATQTTIVVTLDTSRVIPAYLVNALRIVDWDSLMSQQTIPMLTVSQAREILVPLPPLEEQRRIVAHLEAVQEKLRALRDAQAETDEALRRLEQAILDKAFRGEL